MARSTLLGVLVRVARGVAWGGEGGDFCQSLVGSIVFNVGGLFCYHTVAELCAFKVVAVADESRRPAIHHLG